VVGLLLQTRLAAEAAAEVGKRTGALPEEARGGFQHDVAKQVFASGFTSAMKVALLVTALVQLAALMLALLLPGKPGATAGRSPDGEVRDREGRRRHGDELSEPRRTLRAGIVRSGVQS